jgi:hypothetical protein
MNKKAQKEAEERLKQLIDESRKAETAAETASEKAKEAAEEARLAAVRASQDRRKQENLLKAFRVASRLEEELAELKKASGSKLKFTKKAEDDDGFVIKTNIPLDDGERKLELRTSSELGRGDTVAVGVDQYPCTHYDSMSCWDNTSHDTIRHSGEPAVSKALETVTEYAKKSGMIPKP